MKHISISFFSLLLVSLSGVAQETKPAQADTVAVVPVKADRYGLRVGLDLHRPARSFYDDGFKGFEIVADYRLSKKLYFAGELGTVDYTVDDDVINFTTKGSYFKAGIDINTYENWLDMENMIYIGFRYGFSSFSQNLNSYTIYDRSNYFPDVTKYPNEKYSGLSAHWGEIIGGLKAEVYDNLFIGFSVRLNMLITDKKPKGFDNLYIPGFNRTYDGNFGVGFNYTLSYFIPFYKKKIAPKVEEKKTK